MLDHQTQLCLADKFLGRARNALSIGRADLARENLERAIGFMSQVHGELEREYLIGRGAVLPKTSGPVTITEEPPEYTITEYGTRE